MKANNIDGQIRIFYQLPNEWKSFLNFSKADEATLKEEGFFDLITPEYDPRIQSLGEIYFDEQDEIFTYPVLNKSKQQIEDETISNINQLAEQAERNVDFTAIKSLLLKTVELLPNNEMVEYRSLFKPYRINKPLVKGEKFYDPTTDKLFEVVRGHTTALQRKPSKNITLYKEVSSPGFIPNWTQPPGAGYEYQIGDKVYHNGKKWESIISNNVWEPGVYGWKEV